MGRLALLGGGKMGEALLGGLVASGWSPSDMSVAEIAAERRAELLERFEGLAAVPAAGEAVVGAETVIVAVKPNDVAAALSDAAPHLGDGALVLCIAAGITIATLEALVPGHPVVRVMPNTPALVGQGAAGMAAGSHAGDAHMDRAGEILGAVGTTVRLSEDMLDAVTGLSGSGPAYVFYLAEAMIEAGRAEGLPADVVDDLVIQTLVGAAALLAQGAARPEELRAAVTSPGGTTEAAIRLLDERGVAGSLADAVRLAAERSRQLGRP